MSLQNNYKKTLTITPSLPTFYTDDSTFAYVFDIPPDQLTLNLSTSNKVDTRIESTPQNVDNFTLDLTGTLELVATSISVPPNPNATIYYADYTKNAAIFEYIVDPITTKLPIKVGDSIINGIITKIIILTLLRLLLIKSSQLMVFKSEF
jgi:hypothetical protein